MTLRAPKVPINLIMFIVGTVCALGIKVLSVPLISNASINEDLYKKTLISSISSCGKIVIGNDVFMDSSDLIMLAESVAIEKIKLCWLKEVK